MSGKAIIGLAASSAASARPAAARPAAATAARAASGACPARTATGVVRRAATTLVHRTRIARASRARSGGITTRTAAPGALHGGGVRSGARRSGWRTRVRCHGCIASARLIAVSGAVRSAAGKRSLICLSLELGAWRIAGAIGDG